MEPNNEFVQQATKSEDFTKHKIHDIYSNFANLLNSNIMVQGWIKTFRTQKDVSFISLNDGSCFENLQVVITTNLLTSEQIKSLGTGVSVGIKGRLVKSPVKGQAFELCIESGFDLVIYGPNLEANPIAKTKLGIPFLRTVPHLRIRTNTFGAIARIRHQLAMATHDFYGKKKRFVLVAPPQITQNDCEGGGEAFQVTTILKDPVKLKSALVPEKKGKTKNTEVANLAEVKTTEPNYSKPDLSNDFFGAPAYLTVSGQLALETYCLALGGVYCYQSAFRADPSQTSRHVAEFTMLEVEIPFADLTDNMNLAEEYIKYCIQYVLTECESDIKFLDKFDYKEKSETDKEKSETDKEKSETDKFKPSLIEYLKMFVSSDDSKSAEPFARMKYSDVMKTLLEVQANGHKFAVPIPESGVFDFKSEHERYLTDHILKKPVFVTHYPASIKAFYMKPSAELDPVLGVETVECCDLLVPGIGEVLGGSCRTSDYEKLKQSMDTHGLTSDGSLDYYLDLRKFGSVEHCGFGIGMSRLLMMLTGMDNIRDMIEFPRTMGSISY
jgi:asparaginyl-tRNA synthetase